MADVQRKSAADQMDAKNDAAKIAMDAKTKMATLQQDGQLKIAQMQQDVSEAEKDRIVRVASTVIAATKGAEMTSAVEPEVGVVEPTHAPAVAPGGGLPPNG